MCIIRTADPTRASPSRRKAASVKSPALRDLTPLDTVETHCLNLSTIAMALISPLLCWAF